MTPLLGVVGGKFQLLHELGHGGMSSVWLAKDLALDRLVAVKLMPTREEATTVAKLNHPNICAVYEAGQDNEHSWLAMQYIDGHTVNALLPLSHRRAVEIVRDALRGVQHGHDQGVIHLDVKPENILVDKNGRVFVTDFGLSHSPSKTAGFPGEIVGTASYMSPEQAMGRPPDIRMDIYSAGVALDELLVSPPASLQAVVDKATKPKPEDRYATAGAMADALDKWLRRGLWKRRCLAAGVAGVIAAVLGVWGTSYVDARRRETARVASNLCRDAEKALDIDKDELGAIRLFTASLAVKPDARTYLFRGFCHWRLCDFKAALADCDAALALEPNNEAAKENRRMAMERIK